MVASSARPSPTIARRWAADRAWFADGLPEIAYGIGFLATVLFFFVWAESGLAFLLYTCLFLAGGNLLRDAITATKAALAEPAPGAALRRLLRRPRRGTVAKLVGLALLVALAANRAAGLDSSVDVPALTWSFDRWWSLILTVPIPLYFVASAFQLRLPRHLAVGVVGLLGALAGPLLSLTWADALALAAATLGLPLVATGALALRAFLRARPARPSP